MNAVKFTKIFASYGRIFLEFVAVDLPSICSSLSLEHMGLGHKKRSWRKSSEPYVQNLYTKFNNFAYISSPIQTLLSVLEFHQVSRIAARGLYHRSGISPCPEDLFNLCYCNTLLNKCQYLVNFFIFIWFFLQN